MSSVERVCGATLPGAPWLRVGGCACNVWRRRPNEPGVVARESLRDQTLHPPHVVHHELPPVDPQLARFRETQLALFGVSVLKQAKWRALSSVLGDTAGLDALDLGADNGVISRLLRDRGGRWTSADLTDETVDAVRRMVGDRVHRLHDATLPFPDGSFDLIVVVDLLEHVDDDSRLLEEIARCLRPGGRVVLSLPVLNDRSALARLRRRLGLTEQWHGHVHAGYDRRALEALLPRGLRLAKTRVYTRFFSHLLDTALNWAYVRKSRGRATSTAKGMVVTGSGIDAKGLGMLRALYAPMRAFAALDALVPWTRGYMFVAVVESVAAPIASYAASSFPANASAE